MVPVSYSNYLSISALSASYFLRWRHNGSEQQHHCFAREAQLFRGKEQMHIKRVGF